MAAIPDKVYCSKSGSPFCTLESINLNQMDKLQKHDYMNQIEEFLEVNQVYELFEDLLKQLVVAKPENPLDFIIQTLSHPKSKSLT